MISTTKYVNLAKLRDADGSDLVLSLMMITNDLVMGYAFQGWARELQEAGKDAGGYAFYAMRLQLAICFESFSVLKDIAKKPGLVKHLERRDASADDGCREAFNRILELSKGDEGTRAKDYHILRLMRNRGTFHYNSAGAEMVKALERMVAAGLSVSSVTWSEEPNMPVRFVLADEIFESVYRENILGHPDGKDFETAFNESSELILKTVEDIAKVIVPIVYGYLNDLYV